VSFLPGDTGSCTTIILRAIVEAMSGDTSGGNVCQGLMCSRLDSIPKINPKGPNKYSQIHGTEHREYRVSTS
jgi:hypothetical protein